MEPLFERSGLATLRALGKARTLLGFDYDGTLAPFAVHAAEAKMRPSTEALVRILTQRYPVAVISGRARKELQKLLGDVGRVTLLGNHGMEPERPPPDAARWRANVKAWKRVLAARLAGLDGVFLEDKRLSLCVHYRGVPDAPAVARAVRAAASDLPGARHVRGKLLLNLVPEGAPHKGDALLASMRAAGCDRALFVGDDVTDESAFRLGERQGVVGVRVGAWQRSRAAYFVRDQSQVDALLQRLVDARPPATRLPKGRQRE